MTDRGLKSKQKTNYAYRFYTAYIISPLVRLMFVVFIYVIVSMFTDIRRALIGARHEIAMLKMKLIFLVI